MKTVLYTAAALMIGASIFGFVDYRDTNHREEFKSMYTEDQSSQELQDAAEYASVPEIDVVPEVSELTSKTGNDEPKPVVKKSVKKKIKKAKKRTLEYSKFSRAPLREN